MAQMAIRMGMEVVRSAPFTSFAGHINDWIPIGTPIDHDAKLLIFSNFLNFDVMISDINIDNYGKVPIHAGQSLVLDISSDGNYIGQSLTVAKGKRYYAQAIDNTSIPASGAFYLSVCYGEV